MRLLLILSVCLTIGVGAVAQEPTTQPAGGSTSQPTGGGDTGGSTDGGAEKPAIDPEIAKALDAGMEKMYRLSDDRCSFSGKVDMNAMGQAFKSDFTFDYDRKRAENDRGKLEFANQQVAMFARQFQFSASTLSGIFEKDTWRDQMKDCKITRVEGSDPIEAKVESPPQIGLTGFKLDENNLFVEQTMEQMGPGGPMKGSIKVTYAAIGDKWTEKQVDVDMGQMGSVKITYEHEELEGRHVLKSYNVNANVMGMNSVLTVTCSGYKFGAAVDATEKKEEPASEGTTSKPTSRPAGQ